MIIMIIHSFLLFQFYQLSWLDSLVDGVGFNLVYAVMGLGIWYAVAYNKIEDKNLFQLAANHLVVGIIFTALWYFVSLFFVRIFQSDNLDYIQFLANTLPWRLLIGFFYYLIIIMVFYSIISQSILQEKRAEESKLKSLIQEAELNNLKSQINPHFIFNSLNSISSLTLTNPEKAREMIIKLSEFLRYSLKQDRNQSLVSLQEELDHIKKYLEIEKIRFGEKLNFIEPTVDHTCNAWKLPAFILQPLIENAIKHGVYESTNPVNISIDISCQLDLLIHISNSFEPGVINKKGTGTGLKNIKSRLKLLYGNPDLLEITKNPNTFAVKLRIPAWNFQRSL